MTETWFQVEKRVADGIWQSWFAPYFTFDNAYRSYLSLEAERPNIWRITRIEGSK